MPVLGEITGTEAVCKRTVRCDRDVDTLDTTVVSVDNVAVGVGTDAIADVEVGTAEVGAD